MKTVLRVPLVLQLLATAACGEIVGIGDVPDPVGGDADAATPADTGDSNDAGGLDSGRASRDGSGESPGAEGPGGEGTTADGPSAPADGDMESAARDAGGTEASAQAPVDAAACAATWNPYDVDCNACGIMRCCGALATCELLDDAGLDRGMSRCAALVYCIAGYAGTPPPMTGDRLCKMDDQYLPSELANEDAALSCIRASCSVECQGL